MDSMADRSSDATPLHDAKLSIGSSMTRPQQGKNGERSPCHTCRRARLRCDATRPTCKKCTKRGVECLGYGTRALLWVQPSAPDTAQQASTEANSVSLTTAGGQENRQRRKRGRPKLVLLPKPVEDVGNTVSSRKPRVVMSQATQKTQESGINNNIDAELASRVMTCQNKAQLKPGPVPVKYHESLLALRSLDYSECANPDHVSSCLADSTTNNGISKQIHSP